MNKKLSVLLIEDNHAIAAQICEFFDGLAWVVDHTTKGRHGLDLACSHHFDVVVLDLNLPDVDGIWVCEQIKTKAEANVPVLMLTARGEFDDKAEGFESGADDYLCKPFDFRELALRCQALARRNELHKHKRVSIGSLVVDKTQRQATREGHSLKLTNIGFDILLTLVEAYPNPVSRSSLIQRIWADDEPDSDVLRAHIYGLRNVLDKPFDSPAMLHTMINVGYKLIVDDE